MTDRELKTKLVEMDKQGTRHWNYRVIKYADDDGYGLHEVHYVDGDVIAWAEKPIVVGDSVKEISDALLRMRIDTKHRPILEEKTA